MKSLLLFIFFGYFSVTVLLYLFQGKMIFFPQPTFSENLTRYASNEIRLERGDIALTGWYFKGGFDGEGPLLVYYGGNAEDVSLNFSDLDRFHTGSFLFMNYRGYGKSSGKPSEQSLLDDALFVLDHFLASEEIDSKSVVLMGRSLGSGIAVHVAAKRSVGGVILVTPFDSLAAVAQAHYPLFPVRLLLKHRFESASLASGILTPALFLMAENDRIVPLRFSQRLMASWGGQTSSVVIKGADHNTIQASPAYWHAINTYLAAGGHFSLDE